MTEYKPDVDEAIERFMQQWKAAMKPFEQFALSIVNAMLPVFCAYDKALHAIEESQEREEHRCWLKRLVQRFRKTEDADGTAQTD